MTLLRMDVQISNRGLTVTIFRGFTLNLNDIQITNGIGQLTLVPVRSMFNCFACYWYRYFLKCSRAFRRYILPHRKWCGLP